jgi:ribosomal protein S13
MYTNSFIKEQMTCNESAIKPDLTEVVSKMEPCPKYKDLRIALKELASLLPDNNLRNVMSSTSAISSLKPLSVNVPASAPQNTSTVNAAVPAFKQPNSVIKFQSFNGNVKTNYDKIMEKINKFLNSIDSQISQADDEDKQTFTDRKKKYGKVKPLLDAATTEDEVRRIITENQVTFSGNTIVTGGTRKRRMRRVKTQRRRKNARTIKKKKITNNKSGKRN